MMVAIGQIGLDFWKCQLYVLLSIQDHSFIYASFSTVTSKFNSQKSQEDDNVNGSSKRLSAVSTASNNSSTTLDLDFDSVVSTSAVMAN